MRAQGCLLTRKKGDWSWLKQLIRLRVWRGGDGHNVRWLCGATQNGPPTFTDASLGAAWRQTF
eukprot:1330756-Pyramimonas_sp.AAC.1